MELIRAYKTSARGNNTDTDCSAAETQPQLLLNQVRSVYLVTYSQANKCEFPTREYFAKVLVECFQQAGVDVVQWCCSEENHKHGGIHYHAAIKLKKICRSSGCKRVLKQRYDVTVNFSSHHHNYYSAWCYVTQNDMDFQESEGHPDLKSKVAKKGRKRGPGGSKVAKTKKRKHLTSSEVADILLAKNIKTVTELQALAYTQKREGKEDLMDFIIGRSHKAVS